MRIFQSLSIITLVILITFDLTYAQKNNYPNTEISRLENKIVDLENKNANLAIALANAKKQQATRQ